jgi:hypothetical protein
MNDTAGGTSTLFNLKPRKQAMDWSTVLLIVFVVLMVLCCGGMMRMASRGRHDSDRNKK